MQFVWSLRLLEASSLRLEQKNHCLIFNHRDVVVIDIDSCGGSDSSRFAHAAAGVCVRARTISSTASSAMIFTSASDLLAKGWSTNICGCDGMPSIFERISADFIKARVRTVAAGLPCFSASVPSWRPHVVQEPQSATAWITASHLATRPAMTSSGVATLAPSFV